MSSKTVRALYRLFLRQVRDLQKNQLDALSLRAPLNKGGLVLPLRRRRSRRRLPLKPHCQPALVAVTHIRPPAAQKRGSRAGRTAGLRLRPSSTFGPSRRWRRLQQRCGAEDCQCV